MTTDSTAASGALPTSPATRPLTGAEYLESLRDGREIWIYGERVADVTTHPAFRNSARIVARLYDALHDPDLKGVLTTETDTGSGGYTQRYFRAPTNWEEQLAGRDAIAAWARLTYGWLGRAPDYKGAFLGIVTDTSYALNPAWSPDGSKLAFTGSPSDGSNNYNYGIYVVAAGGGTATRVTTDDTLQADNPAWSRVTAVTNRAPTAISLSNSSVLDHVQAVEGGDVGHRIGDVRPVKISHGVPPRPRIIA